MNMTTRKLMTISMTEEFYRRLRSLYADELRKEPNLSFSQFIREALKDRFEKRQIK